MQKRLFQQDNALYITKVLNDTRNKESVVLNYIKKKKTVLLYIKHKSWSQ